MTCIDGDRDWADGGNGLFESFFISFGYVNGTSQTGGYLRFVEIAGTVLNIYKLIFNTRKPFLQQYISKVKISKAHETYFYDA